MFAKLNLSKLQCIEFRITTHLRLSKKSIKEIGRSSHHHTSDKQLILVIFGKKYSIGKVHHAVRADVTHTKDDEYQIEYLYSVMDFPKPPEDFASPEILSQFLSTQRQEVLLDCFAEFSYKADHGWNSTIEIPFKLETTDIGKNLFTHVESVVLSKRENNQLSYLVQISCNEDKVINHLVVFSESWKTELLSEATLDLLKKANELSKHLVSRRRDKENAT